MEHNKTIKVGAFVSGMVVATAIGGYFLFGSKNAKRNRQKVEDTIEDAKADVIAQVKKMKRLSRDKYYEIVDGVSAKYSKMKNVGIDKANEIGGKLKDKWEEIEENARRETEK